MIGMSILQPVVALAAWTMVMWFWLYGTRIPALSAAGLVGAALAAVHFSQHDRQLAGRAQAGLLGVILLSAWGLAATIGRGETEQSNQEAPSFFHGR